MKEERQEYIDIVRQLGGDLDGRQKALDYVRNSDVWVHGAPAPFPYVPYLVNERDFAYIFDQCTTAHRILTKIIRAYLDHPEFRSVLSLPPQVERLVLLPCGYDQLLPMGRFDLFLDEDDLSYKFCEFNTDGAGAASRDYVIGKALMQGEAYQRFAERHKVEQFELFDSWVQAFMRIYRSDRNARANPTVCVTDFRESGVFSDFDRFIAAFQRAGVPCRFVDTRAFEFDGEHLVDPSDGTVIDAIYRRAVTSELLGHLDECQALIDAVAAEKVCLIGHFRTTVVHTKMVNVALFDERARAFLTPEECAFVDAHVPRTYVLSAQPAGYTLDEVKRDREKWIIKPADDYGAHGVYPGVDLSAEEWAGVVDTHLDAGYIVQEFYPPHHVDIVNTAFDPAAPAEDRCRVESWQSMPGVYMYDGKPAGFYCRLGQEGVIALDHGGLCANTFKVDFSE